MTRAVHAFRQLEALDRTAGNRSRPQLYLEMNEHGRGDRGEKPPGS